MNLNIFVGLFMAYLAIYFGAPDIRKDWIVYIRLDAFTLLFLGTCASTLISTSFEDFKGLIKVFRNTLFKKKTHLSPEEAIVTLVNVAEQAQSVSKLALPDLIKNKSDLFLSRGIEMIAASLEKDFIVSTLDTDISENRLRHSKMITTVRTMGSFAPMFGMAGTVIGVIMVLKNVSDIDNIVSGMGLALLTTLYGLFFSSIVFIPFSNKLKQLSDQEILSKEIIREGVAMILDKEIPLKVEKYLTSFLHSSKKELLKKK